MYVVVHDTKKTGEPKVSLLTTTNQTGCTIHTLDAQHTVLDQAQDLESVCYLGVPHHYIAIQSSGAAFVMKIHGRAGYPSLKSAFKTQLPIPEFDAHNRQEIESVYVDPAAKTIEYASRGGLEPGGSASVTRVPWIAKLKFDVRELLARKTKYAWDENSMQVTFAPLINNDPSIRQVSDLFGDIGVAAYDDEINEVAFKSWIWRREKRPKGAYMERMSVLYELPGIKIEGLTKIGKYDYAFATDDEKQGVKFGVINLRTGEWFQQNVTSATGISGIAPFVVGVDRRRQPK